MTVKRLISGQSGQTLRHTPMVRAASAAWELHDLMSSGASPNYVLASGAGSIDAVDTTSTADAGPSEPDARVVVVTSAAGIVPRVGPQDLEGGWYELSTVGGEGELVRVVGVNGLVVELEWHLTRPYPAGSLFRGCTFTTGAIAAIDTVALAPGRVDRYEPLRIVWTVDGRHHQDQVRVVHETDGDLDLHEVIALVRTIWPGINVRLEIHGRDLLPGKVLVADRMIASKERSNRIDTTARLTGEQRNIAIAWRVLYTEAAQGNGPTSGSDFSSLDRWTDYVRDEYEAAIASILTGPGGIDTVVVDKPTRSAEAIEDTTATHDR